MASDFRVDVDPSGSLVTIALSGFFFAADVERLQREIAATYGNLRCPIHQHRTFLDLTRMDIQGQATLEVFAGLANNPRYKGERMAVLFARSLVRLQVMRIAGERPGTRFFDSRAEAIAWLGEERRAAA